MTKYQFIKSKLQIAEELQTLWDNYPLYKFLHGSQYVRKRELEIAECLIDREDWIEVCRITWLLKQLDSIEKK